MQHLFDGIYRGRWLVAVVPLHGLYAVFAAAGVSYFLQGGRVVGSGIVYNHMPVYVIVGYCFTDVPYISTVIII